VSVSKFLQKINFKNEGVSFWARWLVGYVAVC